MEITATSLNRAMQCGGSVWLGVTAPSLPPSDDAIEGTSAHALFSMCLNGTISDPLDMVDRKIADTGFIVPPEMAEYLAPHIEHICRREAVDRYVEEKTDFTAGNVIIRGRADCAQFDNINGILYVDELKYGWRLIEPYNWQPIAYALGLCIRHGLTPKHICFTVHQPRPWHPEGTTREHWITWDDLQLCRQQIVDRFAALPNTVTTGPACYKCSALAICPAARQAALASVDISEHAYVETPDGAQLGAELLLLEKAREALKLRESALMEQAESRLRSGQPVTGFALEQSLGKRQWAEHANPAVILALTGIDITDRISVSPPQAKKRGVSDTIIQSFTVRPSRGFKVVKQDLNRKAAKAFQNS